jgi:hypothetical protein
VQLLFNSFLRFNDHFKIHFRLLSRFSRDLEIATFPSSPIVNPQLSDRSLFSGDSSPAIEMGSESNTITPIRCEMTSSAAVRREECAPAKKNPWD